MKATLFGVFALLFVACAYAQNITISIRHNGTDYDAIGSITYKLKRGGKVEPPLSTGLFKPGQTRNLTFTAAAVDIDFDVRNATGMGDENSFICLDSFFDKDDLIDSQCYELLGGNGETERCNDYCE